MHRLRQSRLRLADDSGNASLEFIATGVLLLIPLVYLVIALSSVQSAALAAEGAARQAVRVYVQAPTTAEAELASERAVEFALADYGVDPQTVSVDIHCTPRANDCLRRLGNVTTTVRVDVPIPLVPPIFASVFPTTVPVESTATERVSRFWGSQLTVAP